MESNHFKVISLALCLLLCVACGSSTQEDTTGFEIASLENGDIICRLGNGMFSNLFRKHSKEKTYSHIGIVYIAADTVYIIHAEANEITGIGHVRKEPIRQFINSSRRWGIYRIERDAHVRSNIASHALHYENRHTPFDMNFSLDNDDKVYCTQLVALAVNKADNQVLITPGYTLQGRQFYAIDDIYLHPQFRCIYQSQ